MRLRFSLVAPLLFSFALTSNANAQVLYGSIVGNIVDESNASVPAATVRITHGGTNQSREITSNEAGGYTFSLVPAGTYHVVVTKEGFQTFNVREVTVEANTVVRVNATLQVGGVAQSVDVQASASALQTDRADVRSEISNKALENVPVTGRSYQSLLFLTPGATQAHYFQNGGINNPSRAMSVSINGTPANNVVVRIDGVSATNLWIEDIQAYTPAIEAIEMVNAVTSSFEAEQGMAGGASVNVRVKSGTNAMHGSAFEYVQNRALRARGFFLPSDAKKTQSNKNIFGGTVGGPIKKDKLFYFASWEGTITREAGGPYALSGLGTFLTIPDAAVRSGNLSASTNPIFDPLTGAANGTARTPFAGNQLPASRLNSIVTGKMLPLLPLPTRPGASNNFFTVPLFASKYHKLDTKVNWNATSKLSANARLSYLPSREDFKGSYPGPLNPLSLDSIITANVTSTAGAATYIATPNLVLDGLFGFTRQHTAQKPGGPDQCWGDQFNLPGSCFAGQRLKGTPIMSINGWTTLGGGQTYDYLDPQYQWTGNAAWTKKNHNVRFGADLLKTSLNHYEVPTATFPNFTFSGGVTALNGGPAPNQYNGFADFLLGLPQAVARGIDNPPLPGANTERPLTLNTTVLGLYVRDQWQISRKLTASVGVRWEYYPVPTRADRGIELFDFAANRQLICGVGSNPKDCGIHVSRKQFSPRLGVAYRPTETLVIRTGFSLNWQQNSMYRNGLTAYPSQISITRSGLNSYSAVGRMEDGFPSINAVDVTSGSVSLPPGSGTTTLPRDFVRGYVMSWNFTVEKSLATNLTVQAGYVGTRVIHGVRSQNLNFGTPGGGSASQPFFRTLGTQAAINVLLPMIHTYYDSFQASMNRRFGKGFTLNAGYTWSKYLSNFSGGIPDPVYFSRNKAVAQEDLPHKFTLSGIQELPFGKGKRFLNRGGVASALAGGWQVNGLLSAFSGSPFTISANATSLNAPGSTQLADQVKPSVQILGGVGFDKPYFDPVAFASVNTARYGTAGFNSLRGPNVVNLDLSLFRDFRVNERFRLQFRAEAFNATNTPHFWSPGQRPNNFQLTFTNNVSNMVLNADGSVRSFNNYATITNVNSTGRDFDERYFRLGLRLSF